MIINKYIATLALSLGLVACNRGDGSLAEPTYIDATQISRIELVPNGPVLIADGKAELRFEARCYYKLGEGDKQQEYLLLPDRTPLDKIRVRSSDGQELALTDVYRTQAQQPEVSFTAHLNAVSSAPTTVSLDHRPAPELTKLRIPVEFVAYYSEKHENAASSITRALLEDMIRRANEAFAGKHYNAPAGCDAGMEFYLKDLTKTRITSAEEEKIMEQISKDLPGTDKVVRVWLMNTVPPQMSAYSQIYPRYTTGEPKDIPGLKMSKVADANAIKKLQPNAVGFAMSFAEVYRDVRKEATDPFSFLLGKYYGLLETGSSVVTAKKYAGQDFDYCADTYSYFKGNQIISKLIAHKEGTPRRYYSSYNIMDKKTLGASLTRDQVMRIRQVIKDCPYRGQGHQ